MKLVVNVAHLEELSLHEIVILKRGMWMRYEQGQWSVATILNTVIKLQPQNEKRL